MDATVQLFRTALCSWLFGYAAYVLLLGTDAFASAPVQLANTDSPVHRLGLLLELATPNACMAITAALLPLSVVMLRWPRWWLGLLIWFLFRIITHRMWLASNGGIQLMENMLFWSAFLHLTTSPHPLISTLSTSAFWVARLQLLLAYAAAAAHKFTGTTWLDGSAMSVVAADPTFNLGWLLSSPAFCTVLTYTTLAFMTLFPIVVWWKPTRRLWLRIGVLFHLCTAIFMGIPQMGFAFIACYALWLNEEEARAINDRLRGLWLRIVPRAVPAA